MRRTLMFLLAVSLGVFLSPVIGYTWGPDVLIHAGYVLAFDADTSTDGTIYVAVKSTDIPNPTEPSCLDRHGNYDVVYIYRSEDGGRSWELLIEFPACHTSGIALVVGEDAGTDLLHLFFSTGEGLAVRNYWVESGAATYSSFGVGPTIGDYVALFPFTVARSYPVIGDSYVLLCAYFHIQEEEIHVFRSRDHGDTWDQVRSVDILQQWQPMSLDLAWIPPQCFILAYSDLLPSRYMTYPNQQGVYFTTAVGVATAGTWGGPWLIKDDETGIGSAVPRNASAVHTGGAFSPPRDHFVAAVYVHSGQRVNEEYVQMLAGWFLERLSNPEQWYRREAYPPGGVGVPREHVCADMLGGRSLAETTIHVLNKQCDPASEENHLYHLFLNTDWFPGTVVTYDEGRINDVSCYESEARLVSFAGSSQEPCIGVAYARRAIVESEGACGFHLYFDSSCNTELRMPDPIFESPMVGSEQSEHPMTAEPGQEGGLDTGAGLLLSRVSVLASAACVPNYSHGIEVSWSFADTACSRVKIVVEGPDGILAEYNTFEMVGSEVLRIALPAGGTVTVTVTARSLTHGCYHSESRSITLPPC